MFSIKGNNEKLMRNLGLKHQPQTSSNSQFREEHNFLDAIEKEQTLDFVSSTKKLKVITNNEYDQSESNQDEHELIFKRESSMKGYYNAPLDSTDSNNKFLNEKSSTLFGNNSDTLRLQKERSDYSEHVNAFR